MLLVVPVAVLAAVLVVLPVPAVVEAEGCVALVVAAPEVLEVVALAVPYALCMPAAPKRVTRHKT